MGAEELARGALEGVDMRASEVSRDWAQREWIVVLGKRRVSAVLLAQGLICEQERRDESGNDYYFAAKRRRTSL
jgi:hypothetical protein